MSIRDQLSAELNNPMGLRASDPRTVTLAGPDGVGIEIDFTGVDTMSCSLREVRLNVPALSDAGLDVLDEWARALCGRINYLLEDIGPLEADTKNTQVLIRSAPPERRDGQTQYYEVFLKARAGGTFSLRRYIARKGEPGRQPVDMQLTHEVLQKLINDLVETIPAAG